MDSKICFIEKLVSIRMTGDCERMFQSHLTAMKNEKVIESRIDVFFENFLLNMYSSEETREYFRAGYYELVK
jgi:hypothetical protein